MIRITIRMINTITNGLTGDEGFDAGFVLASGVVSRELEGIWEPSVCCSFSAGEITAISRISFGEVRTVVYSVLFRSL